MQEVILTFTNDEARGVVYYLRKLYGKDKRTGLAKLCRIAVGQEVSIQARKELDEAEAELGEEDVPQETEQAMSEKSILLDRENVLAILDDCEIRICRVMRTQPPANTYYREAGDRVRFWVPATFASGSNYPVYDEEIMLPRRVGQTLWVRETWATDRSDDKLKPSELPETADLWWLANHSSLRRISARMGKIRPSTHMPRWASRLTLEVTGVDVEHDPWPWCISLRRKGGE